MVLHVRTAYKTMQPNIIVGEGISSRIWFNSILNKTHIFLIEINKVTSLKTQSLLYIYILKKARVIRIMLNHD